MTILMPMMLGNRSTSHETTGKTPTASDIADDRAQQISSASQEFANFALSWARREPALVAQHHREWLS
jgi:hypothetical protein